jgi:hypothetical protein
MLLPVLEGASQTPGLGYWNIVNAKADFKKNWNAFIEGQVRAQKFPYDYFYHEIKGGIGYDVTESTNILVGVGKYTTYQFNGNFKSPTQSNETRLWEQLTFNHAAGALKIDHRYRFEQRFYKDDYRNRFRYRLNVTLPIRTTKFYLNAFEEIFLTNTRPHFERNRLFGGVSYKFTDLFSFQIGYVTQYDYNKGTNPYTKNFVQTSLLFNLNTSNKQYAQNDE